MIMGILVSFATAGTVYLEGPDQRGEGPLPLASGTGNDWENFGEVTIDIYAENLPGFAGFQLAIDLPSPPFYVAYNHVPPHNEYFGDRKIVWNEELFPSIYPVFGSGVFDYYSWYDVKQDGEINVLDMILVRNWLGAVCNGMWPPADVNGDCVVNILDIIAVRNRIQASNQSYGLVSLLNESIAQKTWLMSVTYWYTADARGTYTIGIHGAGTRFGNADAQAMSYGIVPGSFTITNVLTVGSTPLAGVGIEGDKPGVTNYTAGCNDGQTVSLTAPKTASAQEVDYGFVRWVVDGQDKPGGQTTVQVPIDFNHAAQAEYHLLGDFTRDCSVNVLDLIELRNHLYDQVSTDDNWKYDLTGDGYINVLDMITLRNHLNTVCP